MMLRPFLAILLALAPTLAGSGEWTEYSHIGLWSRTKYSIVYFDTSVASSNLWPAKPQAPPANGEFQTIDLDWMVPEDTGHVLLRAWTMIGGMPGAVCNLGVAFRPPGSTDIAYGDYATQAHGATERQAQEIWVPVGDGMFEYAASWSGAYGCVSYGVNIELLGYARN
jgi:hypothetical protein